MPRRPSRSRHRPRRSSRSFRGLVIRIPRRTWIASGLMLFLLGGAVAWGLGFYYVKFAGQIDARLHGERDRVLPRVFARPLELFRGQSMTDRQLVERLNDLGYTRRSRLDKPGEFSFGPNTAIFMPREGRYRGVLVRVTFSERRKNAAAAQRITGLEAGGKSLSRILLEPPLLTALISTGREKRRQVPLNVIPSRMVQAVLAIEDRRFYDHPGVDVIRTIGAIVTNLRGEKKYLVGGSTITQQLVKNFFLTPEKSLRRKLSEQFMALILERKTSKDDILELYLNEVYLGQRGSFAVHGVAEAARLFFGKDVSNLTLAEAATIAGVIQSPYTWSPFANAEHCRERRNVVLHAMAEEGFITPAAAGRTSKEPLHVVRRALEAQAPYFVDVVGRELAESFPGITTTDRQLDVYTTLDLQFQRLAQDALQDGLERVDELLARRKRAGRAQAALIAVDPRTGEVLALVGGRSYNQSQFNRAISARRQPGSVFKPFVYLAAFERALEEGRTDLTAATLVDDMPATFQTSTDEEWAPGNYEDEYDGLITLRRALALSRNLATIRVAEMTGYDRVARLWDSLGVGANARAYPSITLGVFEATPYDVATAYTLFANGGEVRPLRVLSRIVADGEARVLPDPAVRRVASPETSYLVTHMMRSVVNEGTGAAARAMGFALEAAGKSGTTNDLRDAWFVGFTPELLTVVWVGMDDNGPLGLSGSRAALPIWAAFMARALAGHEDLPFEEPEGIVHAEIDRDTGKLATPVCPRVLDEVFIGGTEPITLCDIHRF